MGCLGLAGGGGGAWDRKLLVGVSLGGAVEFFLLWWGVWVLRVGGVVGLVLGLLRLRLGWNGGRSLGEHVM